MTCPYCGAKGVNVTTSKMRRKLYFCVGPDAHEFEEGEMPPAIEPGPAPEAEPAGIVNKIKRLFA